MSDYLPHGRIQGMQEAQDVLDKILEPVIDDFDSVVCCGLSGDAAVIWAYRHNKRIIRVRKESDQSHGTWVEGRSTNAYIIIDDFCVGGKTLLRMLDCVTSEYNMFPLYVVFYNTIREAAQHTLPDGRSIRANGAYTGPLAPFTQQCYENGKRCEYDEKKEAHLRRERLMAHRTRQAA